MELELILRELQPFELSHFRQLFCIVGYGVCVINSSYILMNYLETMQTYCGYIKDVHVNFCRPKNNFRQNYSMFDLHNLEVSLQHRVASLCNQLLQGGLKQSL